VARIGLGGVEGEQRRIRIKNYCMKMRVLSDGHWVQNNATDENMRFGGILGEEETMI